MRKEDCYFLGRITRKHGLSGNVILKLDTDQPDFYKKHLQGGVAKGAFSEAEAEKRFNTWLAEKEAKIQGKKDGLAKSKDDAKKAALEAENKANEARINAKKQAEEEAKAAAEAAEAPVEEAPAVEAEGDAPAEETEA